jgi:hypothetical protein
VVDTPFLNDGADESLRKTVSLLNKIEAKTGSATISGPVTVTNEVEIKNDANNPLPVSDNNGSLTVDGTVELGATSLSALENISVTFPATQNVNVTNAGLSVSVSNLPATQPVSGSVSVSNFPATQPVSGTFWQATQPVSGSVSVSNFPATQPVSLATAPTTPVTGTFWQATQPVSLATAPTTPVTGTFWQATQPISGTVTANTGLTQPLTDTQLRAASVPISQATAANLNATVVGSGSFTAAQATASSLKAQAQILDSAGSLLTYAATGTAGTPGVDVVSIQGVSSGVAVTVSGPVTDTQLRASSISVSDRGSVGQATVTTFTSTSSLVLMASNSARKLLTVFNEGSGLLYLLYGVGTASITNYSVRVASSDYLEIEKYTGAVTGIFGGAGTARVTEIS